MIVPETWEALAAMEVVLPMAVTPTEAPPSIRAVGAFRVEPAVTSDGPTSWVASIATSPP